MDRFNALGRGAQIMLVAGVLLFISLFLPWQNYTGPFAEDFRDFGGDTSVNALHGFAGWVLAILTVVLLAWLIVRLASVNIPLPVSTAMTAAILAVLIVFFAIIKNLADDYSAWGSYVGVVLAILVAVGAFQTVQEAGGVDNLKSEIPGMPSSGTTAAAPPPPPAAEAAAPPPPPAAEVAPAAPEAPSAPPMSAAVETEAAASEPDDDTDSPSTERGA